MTTETTPITEAAPEPMLNVNGKSYRMSSLSPEILEYVEIHRKWEEQHKEEKLKAFKTEAALKAIGLEIQNRLSAVDAMAEASKAITADEKSSANEVKFSSAGRKPARKQLPAAKSVKK